MVVVVVVVVETRLLGLKGMTWYCLICRLCDQRVEAVLVLVLEVK